MHNPTESMGQRRQRGQVTLREIDYLAFHMHSHGRDIHKFGYKYIVEIENTWQHGRDGIPGSYSYQSEMFKEDLEATAYDETDTINAIKFPELNFKDPIWLWNGYRCVECITDGEARGSGIYVFFRDEAGADNCSKIWGKRVL